MQFETILLKYTPIFNYLGESCVMASDFQLTDHSSIKRRLTYVSIFISFFMTIFMLFVNIPSFSDYYIIKTKVALAVFLILLICTAITKLFNICQMHFWLNNLPKMYKLFKELQIITGNRYEMNFQQFHIDFMQNVLTIFGLILVKVAIISLIYENPVLSIYESLVLTSNYYSSFFYVYFYVSMLKNLISFYTGYLEQKVLCDKPKTLPDIKSELYFIKATHFKLYEISKILNATFGWMFVSIVVQKFVEILGSLFYIFLRLECTKLLSGLRNY